MIYICDFYAHQKEAVSNQIEMLRKKTRGTLFAAGIFMEQKFLSVHDIREKRFVFPRTLFYLFLPFVIILSRGGVHIFEEDPSRFQKILLNLSSSPLYISLYRRPTLEYIAYLKQLRKLRSVFVEMELHKKLLVEQGFPADIIKIVHAPSLFPVLPATRQFIPSNPQLLFASWNKGSYEALSDRGILFLLEILMCNPHASLTILLRDHETTLLEHLIKEKGLSQRVHLALPHSFEELGTYYQLSDFVVFLTIKRITKDIPNSVLDGFAHGKPCIISTATDFATIVERENLGLVLRNMQEAPTLRCSVNQYRTWSKNALHYALQCTKENYENIVEYYS